MRFRLINQQNVKNFLPIKFWKEENSSTLLSDAIPDESIIGTKIMFYFDEHFVFGEIIKVSGRHATIKTEELIGSSDVTTVNWSHLRIADENCRKKENPEAEKNIEHIKNIRKKIQDIKVNIKLSAISDMPQFSKEKNYEIFNEKYINLSFILEEISRLKIMSNNLEKELMDLRGELIKSGFEEQLIPKIYNSFSSEQEIRANRKKHNAEIKSKLDHVRIVTKMILIETIKSAGDLGISSENILGVICDPEEDAGTIFEQINPHRVMGMLSAMSRNKEVALTEENMWILL